MKRFLLVLLVLAAAWLGSGYVLRLFASDEAKVRWLVAGMEEAYNTGRPGSCVGPLARDWRHEGSEIDRQLLLGALFETARDRDKDTRALRSRVEVDEDAAAIVVEGERATLSLEAVFSRLRQGAWSETWRARITAQLENGADGWEIVTSRHEDVTGTHLGR